MKKILMILMAFVMAFAGIAALAEETPVTREAPDPDLYSGVWQCDRASIDIVWEEEGYRVLVEWANSAWETTTWEYSCYYHEDDCTLVSMPFGRCTEWVYGEDGECVSAEEAYDDGTAVFSLDDDGCLIWQDEKENAGEGMKFEWISLFDLNAARHHYDIFETADGVSYDLFVVTKMNYGEDHQVTSVTGHYERIILDDEDFLTSEDAPGSEKTYPLAADFSADMLTSSYDEIALAPVTDLYEWYIDAYIGRDDYDGHEWVFASDIPEDEADMAEVDFWFVTTQIELNEADEIQYMQWIYVPWF